MTATSVTLSWETPEEAADFKRIREALRGGFTWDADRLHLLELVRDSEITEEGQDCEADC